MQIGIPHNWSPRTYQAELWDKIVYQGIKRAVYIWHRRAGKDLLGLNRIIRSAVMEQVGTYWHVFPTYNQGKKAIWAESDINGRPYLDYFPKELIHSKNEQEMKIRLVNGSVYQIVGSDNIDALRGAGIKGVVFSEFAEQIPTAWEVIQPMIMATNGWALFNFTPKGLNHAYQLYEMAVKDPTWYAEILTADDTMPEVFTKEQINQIKDEFLARGKTLDLFNQEYYCSFTNPIEGAYYASIIKGIEDKQIINVPHEVNIPVSTWWDLGVADSTSIWFTQNVGREIRVIDYIENTGVGLDWYIKEIKNKPYIYENHNAPHDIAVREYTSGKARIDIARELGIDFRIVPNIPRQDGINAARAILSKCYFDKTNCQKGLMALKNYKKAFDQKRNCFKDEPLHDWASNGADAFRYFAVGWDDLTQKVRQPSYYIYQQ
jgi:hypothetical protein